jgi:ATP-dependent DNA helicase DinG
MDFEQKTRAVFEAGGALARSVTAYKPRSGQTEMAGAVAQTMDKGGMLVVEAGTGVGKTFAYLIPAMLSGDRVLISTATKTLQDQLYLRDIPFLKSTLGVPVRTALLKGRSSYLCTYRMESARLDGDIETERDVQQLARVELWAMQTRSGDLSEVDGLDESSSIIPVITSSRDNCLGARCAHAASCFVNKARREAMAADLVVVNHHLFFADLNVRESGVSELLPSARCVIFDEAHQLNEIGVQFLGKQWSTGQVESFATDLQKLASMQARGFADWAGIAADLNGSVSVLCRLFNSSVGTGKLSWSDGWIEGGRGAEYLVAIKLAMLHALEATAICEAVSAEFIAMHARGQQVLESLEIFIQPVPAEGVRWIDVGRQVRLVQSPLDIAASMQARVIKPQADQSSRKSWIFTSATLGADAALTWFVESCGLQGAEVLRVESPFDYASQASLYIPAAFPRPDDSGHSAAVAQLVVESALRLGGGVMVLTTTLRAMRAIADFLRLALQGRDELKVLVQGQHSKRALIDMFTALESTSVGCIGNILVASMSFWEGVDIPGDALQLLVIDKLPFAPPDDPVQVARAQNLDAKGLSAFKYLHLPHAAVALKQGAGRLIRRETDQGVLIICDVRMSTMGYGKQLVKALPPMQRLASHQALLDKLDALTRPSTTGHLLDARP